MCITANDIYCSVVMPVHNGADYLEEAIKSILNQSFNNYELLVIENCSSDNSLEIIQSFNDPRIRIIHEKKIGQVNAYNRGFRESKGDLIFLHDQDDISVPSRFKKQIEYLIKNDIDILGSYFCKINENGEIIQKITVPVKHDDIKRNLIIKNESMFNSSCLISKKVINSLGGFDNKYFPSADYEFYLRGITKFVCGNIPEYLYYWRIHKNQISNKYKKEVYEKTFEISVKYIDEMNFDNRSVFMKKGLIGYYNNRFFYAIMNLTLSIIKDVNKITAVKYLLLSSLLAPIIYYLRMFGAFESKTILSIGKRNNDPED